MNNLSQGEHVYYGSALDYGYGSEMACILKCPTVSAKIGQMQGKQDPQYSLLYL